VNAVFSACLSLMTVVSYHDLRATKEGPGIDRLATVFD